MKIEQYHCPGCGGIVRFDSASGKLLCLSCKTEFEPAAFARPQRAADAPEPEYADFEPAKFKKRAVETESGVREYFDFELADAVSSWNEEELRGLRGGSCPSCGAEFVGDENTVSTVCRWCGNATIVLGRLRGDLKPDRIIPFKEKKDSAVFAIEMFCENKPLLPRNFTRNNHVEAVQGMYAPFWLFNASAEGTADYKVQEGHGKHAMHFNVTCDGAIAFDRIPVDASLKLDDNYMDSLEPYDYGEMVEFNKSFLAGYAAEKYDVSANESKARAERRAENSLKMQFMASAEKRRDTIITKELGDTINVTCGKPLYALLPVWVLNTRFRDKNYRFMMNGQTGQLAGELPIDKSKAVIYGLSITGGMGALLTLLMLILNAAGTFESPSATAGVAGAGFLVLAIVALACDRIHIAGMLGCLAVGSFRFASDFIKSAFTVPLALVISISWIVSAGTALFIIFKWIKQMNSAHAKTMACDYTVPGSYRCTVDEC